MNEKAEIENTDQPVTVQKANNKKGKRFWLVLGVVVIVLGVGALAL